MLLFIKKKNLQQQENSNNKLNQINQNQSNQDNPSQLKEESKAQGMLPIINHIFVDNNCVQCKNAAYIDTRIRKLKKENPCLVDPREVK